MKGATLSHGNVYIPSRAYGFLRVGSVSGLFGVCFGPVSGVGRVFRVCLGVVLGLFWVLREALELH